MDLHTLALLDDQGLSETFTHLVVVEDVRRHHDVVARTCNGRVRRRIGGRAVLQQHDSIAAGERAADDGLLERDVAREDIGRLPCTAR